MIAQITEGAETFTKFAGEFGIIAACFVAMLGFVLWAGHGALKTLIDDIKANNARIAEAVEKMSKALITTSDSTSLINRQLLDLEHGLGIVSAQQAKHIEAMELALEAAKTDDQKERYKLIDEARRKLG